MDGRGDIGITIREAAALFLKLKAANEAKDDFAAEEVLDQVKRKIIFFPTFLNIGATSATKSQELLLVREVLEHAVLLNARKKDMDEMERYYSMLQTYYNDVDGSLIPESSIKNLVVGLNLVRLLVCHRVAEFHSELERVPPQHQRSSYVRFAVQMERYLMEGSYNKLLHARSQAPSNEYMSVVELLEGTVRHEVARCLPHAYASIAVSDAQAMMMLKSEDEVRRIADRQKWITSDNGSTFVFQRADVDAAKKELPFAQILQQRVAFAAELQRVV